MSVVLKKKWKNESKSNSMKNVRKKKIASSVKK